MEKERWFKIVGFFTIIGAIAALLVVPEVRKFFGLDSTSATQPATQQNPQPVKPQPQQPPEKQKQYSEEKTITVSADAELTNSQVKVKRGQTIEISATGQANGSSTQGDPAFGWYGPDGWGRDMTFNTGRRRPLPPGSSFMALCYRIASGVPPIDDEGWQLAGSNRTVIANTDGDIYFTVNDAIRDEHGRYWQQWRTDNQGSFSIRLRVRQ